MAKSSKSDFGGRRDIGHWTYSSRRAEMGKARVHRDGHASRRRTSQHSIEYHAGIKALGARAEHKARTPVLQIGSHQEISCPPLTPCWRFLC